MSLEVAAVTHPGKVRERNEDGFLVASLDGALRVSAREVDAAHRSLTFPLEGTGVIVALSDGMGGAAAGDVASAVSLQAVYEELVRAPDSQADGSTSERLRRVIRRASQRVRELGVKQKTEGMGATLTAMLVSGDTAHFAQVGDSRAYLLRDGKLRQVTRDQSYVQLLVDAGVISPEEAKESPLKNVILESMGSTKDPTVDVGRIALNSGDRVLLCSDGLTNAVDEKRICAVLATENDLSEACSELLVAAIEGGAPDNVTVIVAQLA